MGISLPILNTLAGALGAEILAPPTARAAGTPGGTVRVAMTMPTAAIDPVTIDDQSLVLPQQTGEFLAYSSPKLMLTPVLAEMAFNVLGPDGGKLAILSTTPV